MEIMTNDMSEIARKTKTETVSMKIITLVTLFFLPGTFIAVSCSFFFHLVSPCAASIIQFPCEDVSAIAPQFCWEDNGG